MKTYNIVDPLSDFTYKLFLTLRFACDLRDRVGTKYTYDRVIMYF